MLLSRHYYYYYYIKIIRDLCILLIKLWSIFDLFKINIKALSTIRCKSTVIIAFLPPALRHSRVRGSLLEVELQQTQELHNIFCHVMSLLSVTTITTKKKTQPSAYFGRWPALTVPGADGTRCYYAIRIDLPIRAAGAALDYWHAVCCLPLWWMAAGVICGIHWLCRIWVLVHVSCVCVWHDFLKRDNGWMNLGLGGRARREEDHPPLVINILNIIM